MRRSRTILPVVLCIASCCVHRVAAEKPNILIVTVDDMSADSLGAFGCELANTSPGIDAFAKTAFKFNHAFSLVGNCMPGRNIMWSGLYSHVNGVEGFQQNTQPSYPVLCDLAKRAGYFTAIRGKASHSTPYHPYPWDANLDTAADGKKYSVKDIASYGESTSKAIRLAKENDQPFCLMVNISDPHKPFYAGPTDPHQPSRVFTADEVPVPGFLPSDKIIRSELAEYYSSVRRADDCFLSVMKSLDQSGEKDNTFVMFLSDHGMPLPFAKTQLYYHSLHTPLMVRWPGVTKQGDVDDAHMVSAIDFLPTLLDVMQAEHPAPESLHGRSFAPILQGQSQPDRDFVIVQYNENSGRNRHPMRGIQTKGFLYLYNPWSDGHRKFATATTGTATYRQMVARAPEESDVAARLDLFDHRVVEEFYHTAADQDCLINLIDSPGQAATIERLRKQLATSLTRLADPVAPLVADHQNDALREAFMAAEDERTVKAKAGKKRKSKGNRKQGSAKVISFAPIGSISPGAATIRIHHQLPKKIGTQQLHVTLKDASGKRVQREVVTISGTGDAEIKFNIPDLDSVRVSAFVGRDYGSNMQHITTDPINVQ
ncbi:sulfatase [Planctomycetes bacterium K23_9]|uniref:Choline-sulfatase n=1 Tax=Stieleria marina TaxID=1930275 RepID=A0A517NQL1_9BACT|nr:Choline-sulfatase [Planctomycetes bacterium K23_9]